jgi:hypothetical protein
MDEDFSQTEDVGGPGENDPANPEQDGGEPAPNPAREGYAMETGPEATRLAGLNAQLTSLRSENAAQLAAYAELARGLPGLVPELVGGSSLEAVQGSVAAAREAYNRITASLTPAASPDSGVKSFGPMPGAGGGGRSGPGEDPPARLASERGVNLIYQALAGGKNGNLAR